MSKKQEFLDPEKQHTLTEQECNLVSIFRTFSKAKREAIFKALFMAAVESAKPKEKTP